MQEQRPYIIAVAIFIIMFALAAILMVALNCCTVSMTMNHSEGGQTSLDEDQTTTPSTNASVPVSLTGIPGTK
jgi:hypothetical protein